MRRGILVGVLAALLLGITAAMLWVTQGASPAENAAAAPAVQTPAPIGGGFTLIDQDGRQVKDADFRGRLMLVFFGYTHCPDVCPTTLAVMSNALNDLGPDASQVAPLFITVDPERDTPARMKEYLKNFNSRIIGLTGSKQEIDRVSDEYKVYHRITMKKAAEAHGPTAEDEEAAHSGFIYLMDRRGHYLAHFTADTSAKSMADSLRAALKSYRPLNSHS